VSLVKIDARKKVLFLWVQMTLYLALYRKTVWKSESNERLVKVCVLRDGVNHSQILFFRNLLRYKHCREVAQVVWSSLFCKLQIWTFGQVGRFCESCTREGVKRGGGGGSTLAVQARIKTYVYFAAWSVKIWQICTQPNKRCFQPSLSPRHWKVLVLYTDTALLTEFQVTLLHTYRIK
jgi:hypothetical protein